jgi:4-amino-4-deoxy-L-arabinose transferase-like glycosyltransferase
VHEVLDHSARAFRMTLLHSRVLFWLGALFAIATVGLEIYAALAGLRLESALLGGLFGGGVGLGFVVSAFLYGALDRIRRSAGDFAQIQVIVIGFLDQLALLTAA